MNSNDRTHGRIAAGAIAAGLACALALGGCSQTSTSSASATTSAASTTASSSDGTTLTATKAADLDVSNMFTDKDLSGNYENGSAVTITLADNASTASSSAGVSISGNVITISKGGTYVVTGSLTDGQIVVDAGDSDKVQIVLEGVTITNSALPAVYVKSADKTFLTVEGGQASSLATTGTIAQASDDKADATVFSHDDLTINGTGTLSVSSAQGHAIVSKDDLVCAGVTLNVTASGSGLKANNSVRIASGTYNIKVDTDAIHADTSSDALGYVYVAGGTLTVNAGDDAVHAEGATRVDGGTIDIQSCYEGLEGQTVLQTAGDVSIVSTDDSVNAASPSTTSGTADTGMGGTPSATAGSDFHGGGAPGMDANATSATSGATGSGDASGGGGMGLGMANDVDDSCDLTISGGTLTCTTGGDGLDSNGTLEVSGGTVRVWGPEDSGNGALDYGSEATVSGGTVIAAGASGMAENFSAGTQCAALVSLSGSAGDTITVTDAAGNVLMSGTTGKSYQCVVVSSPSMQAGQTYTVSNGSASTSVTMSSTIVGSVTQGGATGGGRFSGGMGKG